MTTEEIKQGNHFPYGSKVMNIASLPGQFDSGLYRLGLAKGSSRHKRVISLCSSSGNLGPNTLYLYKSYKTVPIIPGAPNVSLVFIFTETKKHL